MVAPWGVRSLGFQASRGSKLALPPLGLNTPVFFPTKWGRERCLEQSRSSWE